jgi:indolepyruvate ferredoxin oxidoreductase beta subunit
VLLALEWAEAMRWINHLKPGRGTFISDTQHIMPPFACRSRRRDADAAYSRETPRQILDQIQDGYAMDATQMARDLGNERAANTMLLGVLSTALDFAADDWREVISRFVPPKTVDINIKAFDQGREWARLVRDNPDQAAEALHPLSPAAPAALLGSGEHEGDFVALDINIEWCKSCDICVKMCPERCLKLDSQLKAVLTKPELCTGCRICEWLCPDLAITVHRDPATVKASA